MAAVKKGRPPLFPAKMAAVKKGRPPLFPAKMAAAAFKGDHPIFIFRK
jgi:hypothetical protein